ncbi:carbon-nitrogen hydrolase family protein [Castellaniella sp.]|uniref:carbon-nitrogen hydrolase family protein n=1 Tax=Castellaniella sp. TaxID=1955812 RepID=UPI0035682A4D
MEYTGSMRVAAIQMVSGTRVDENLMRAAALIRQAADTGARLVVLPEYFCLLGRQPTDKRSIAETAGQGPIQDFLAGQARQHKIWLVGGSVPLVSPDPGRVYNTCLVFDPDGRVHARYDKLHLFGFQGAHESYDESLTIRPGPVCNPAFDLPLGRTGLGICYDLRFPEFFRAQGDVQLILLPAAFTHTTGAAHWDILLRARAIENQCYVLASAQGGQHENGRQTWGHTMLVDPWGAIVDCLATGPGVVAGQVSVERIQAVRQSLPALQDQVIGRAT